MSSHVAENPTLIRTVACVAADPTSPAGLHALGTSSSVRLSIVSMQRQSRTSLSSLSQCSTELSCLRLPLPQEWIPDGVWLNVVALSSMDAFRDIPDAVQRSDAAWRAWCVGLSALRLPSRCKTHHVNAAVAICRQQQGCDDYGCSCEWLLL